MAFSSLLSIAIIQGETTGEDTGITKQAVEAAQNTTEQAGEGLSGVSKFFNGVLAYLTSAEFIGNVVATVIIVVLAIVFYRVAVRLIPRILLWRRPEDETPDAAALARIKRQDTAVTLVRNTLRYIVFAIVALFVFSIFLREILPVVAGATILAAVVGFGAQSFLRDIIAGFSILFEGQYNVGDFIEVEPTKAAGIVEEFGLRTTKIRALSGELIYIPNGVITGVTNYVSGQQRFTIEVQLKDEEAAERVLEEAKQNSELYLTPPRLMDREDSSNGGPIRLRLLAGVLPSMAWLVEENLVEQIKGAAGEEGLAAEPLVYKVDRQNVWRLRHFIPPEQ